MAYEFILLEKKDNGVAVLTLNRPERLNAINYEVQVELADAIREVDIDDEVRVLVITGAGRAFCAGADLGFSELRHGSADGGKVLEDPRIAINATAQGKLLYSLQKDIFLRLAHLSKPVIGMINGHSIGAGFILSMVCDMRTGSPNAKFNNGFAKVGVSQSMGGAWLLPRIIGVPKAMEIILSGRVFDGEEAYDMGYLNRLYPADQLEAETMKFAAMFAEGAPVAQRLSKMLIYKGLESTLENAMHLATASEFICFKTEDNLEGIKAIADKRPPQFKGR